jgi:23S rRNA (cytosine1962-C5)-methyltransferase
VLNTFAYTGSLSVAAGAGKAAHVTTLDLSKPTIRWAEENWAANGLEAERARFVAGDVFEWLPRLKREGRRYDCLILDPPSFSRGAKGSFSTAKDLRRLHELALELLAPGGVMATSINSANVTRARFEAELVAAAAAKGRSLEILEEISQPDTFPSRLGDPQGRYLKGWVLRAE